MSILSRWRRQPPRPEAPKATLDSYMTVMEALDQLCRGAVNSRSFLAATDALPGWEVLNRDPRATIMVRREFGVGSVVSGDEAHVMLDGGSAMNLYFLAFDIWISKLGLDRTDPDPASDTLETRVTHFQMFDLVFQFTDQPAMKVVPDQVWSGGAIRIWGQPKGA